MSTKFCINQYYYFYKSYSLIRFKLINLRLNHHENYNIYEKKYINCLLRPSPTHQKKYFKYFFLTYLNISKILILFISFQ